METVGTVPLHENQGPAGECTRHARADVIYNTTQSLEPRPLSDIVKEKHNEPPEEQMRGLRVEGGDCVATGSEGTPVDLYTNYFGFHTASDWCIYEYEVDFTPRVPYFNMKLREVLFTEYGDLLGPAKSFLGQTMLLKRKLPDLVTKLSHKWEGDTIEITIKRIAELTSSSSTCLWLFKDIFWKMLDDLNVTSLEGRFYDKDIIIKMPQHKLQIIPLVGYSVQQYECGPLLSLDISHLIVMDATVLDVMYELYHKNQRKHPADEPGAMSNVEVDDFMNMVVGHTFITRHRNCELHVHEKCYTLAWIAWTSKPDETVPKHKSHRDTDITYKEFYKQAFNLSVTDDDQLLIVGKPAEKIVGCGCVDYEMLVPEFCYITGLGKEERKDSKVRQDVDIHLKPGPVEAVKQLQGFLQKVNSSPQLQEQLELWDMQLSEEFLPVWGRQFPKEGIGNWSNGIKEHKMTEPVSLTNWIVIYHNHESEVTEFVKRLREVALQMGMKIEMPRMIELPDDSSSCLYGVMETNLKVENPQLLMCIVLTDEKGMIDAIKQFTCSDQPVPCEVLVYSTIKDTKQLESVATNVAVRLNVKLGGEAWTVPIPIEGLMVIGIDVVENTVWKGELTQVTGLVASFNQNITRFYSRVIFNRMSEGEVTGFVTGHIFYSDALTHYRNVNNVLPKVILVYRDGVIENEDWDCPVANTVKDIQRYEIPAIEQAWKSVGGEDYTFDFFLVSHSVKDGTATPTHYDMIHNKTSLQPDDIQRLTYKLCHLYANVPGTIQVPAPCQYAQDVARLVGEN